MNDAGLMAGILNKEGVEYIPAFPHRDISDDGAKLGLHPLILLQERHVFVMLQILTKGDFNMAKYLHAGVGPNVQV